MESGKKVYYLQGEPQALPAVQTDFPLITMVYPGIKGKSRYSQAFRDLIFWHLFQN